MTTTVIQDIYNKKLELLNKEIEQKSKELDSMFKLKIGFMNSLESFSTHQFMLKIHYGLGYLICNAEELNIDEHVTELIIKGKIVIVYKSGGIKYTNEVTIKTDWIENILAYNEYQMEKELFKIFMENDD
jgi:hypothetical protein